VCDSSIVPCKLFVSVVSLEIFRIQAHNETEKAWVIEEDFRDTKGVISIRTSKKYRQHNDQTKKGKTTIYKTPHTN
jgi:homoserine trans-succinylase